MNEKIKIIIVDDSQLLRDGISVSLNRNPNLSVIDQAANGVELMVLLPNSKPDIILLDIKMPVMDGEKTLEFLNRNFPEIKVIMMSMYFEQLLIEEYKGKGASGFIPKGCDDVIITDTILSVHQEKKVFNEEISKKLSHEIKNSGKKHFLNEYNLSVRELEIVRSVCLFKFNKQIADVLCVTERTVEFHKTNIYKKTGFECTSDLILYAIESGIWIA